MLMFLVCYGCELAISVIPNKNTTPLTLTSSNIYVSIAVMNGVLQAPRRRWIYSSPWPVPWTTRSPVTPRQVRESAWPLASSSASAAVILTRLSPVVIFGEDVAFGGVFRCTVGLRDKYGEFSCSEVTRGEVCSFAYTRWQHCSRIRYLRCTAYFTNKCEWCQISAGKYTRQMFWDLVLKFEISFM